MIRNIIMRYNIMRHDMSHVMTMCYSCYWHAESLHNVLHYNIRYDTIRYYTKVTILQTIYHILYTIIQFHILCTILYYTILYYTIILYTTCCIVHIIYRILSLSLSLSLSSLSSYIYIYIYTHSVLYSNATARCDIMLLCAKDAREAIVGIMADALVWYGMVWYGMVWYSILCYGIVWYSVLCYGIVSYRIVSWGLWRIPYLVCPHNGYC